MKKATKILMVLFVVVLFSTVGNAMVKSGKIDVSSVPVLNSFYASSEDTASAVEKTQADSPAADVTEQDNATVQAEVPAQADVSVQMADDLNTSVVTQDTVSEEEVYGSEIYSVAKAAVPASSYTSITDVDTDSNGNIYAADATGYKLYKLNSNGSIQNTYNAGVQLNGVCVGSNYVYALEGELAGTITVLDFNLSKVAQIEVGHTPNDMVINGTTGYVVNRFSNSISVIDLNSNKVTKTIDVDGREPNSLCLANGKLYVACHLPEDSSRETVISSNIIVINTATNSVVKTMDLINGADGVKGICASPDGKTVYVSHIIARYTYPTTQLDRGWINTNAISIIDSSSDSVITNIMLDEVELGASNPWGITVSTDGKKLICALSGTDEVMVVDIAAMNAKINAVRRGSGVVDSMEDIPDYLPFLDDCRTRIALSGKGARAVCAVSGKVYVGLYFAGSIDVVDISNNSVKNLSFVNQPESDDVRKGEIIFSDATLCYQKWQSCLSCHPDARVDGLNWDNINDGLGNPKSAKSMMYSHRTPPTMSTGIRATAEIAVRAGMKYIQFNALEEEQMAYIDEYLKTLQPVQSPYLNRDGTLTESAARGKDLFNTVGCATCHPAPLYTDRKLHTVKSTTDTTSWENRAMDTACLVEVWRTGPWIFDGRFATMKEAVAYYAQDKNLTDAQITDLTNYVLSIGDEGEQYGVEQVVTIAGDTTSINVLVPGGTISYFTVRRQNDSAVTTANLTVTLTSGGKQITQVTKSISGVEFNKAVKVDTGISIPADLAKGAKLTISIADTSGNALASDYVIEY